MPRKPPEPLANASLAYENDAFLNGPDGRIIRIMAEYSEPLARFRRERIQDTVVFFGSARFRALDEASRELELLENTGSQQRAPEEEQPAREHDKPGNRQRDLSGDGQTPAQHSVSESRLELELIGIRGAQIRSGARVHGTRRSSPGRRSPCTTG